MNAFVIDETLNSRTDLGLRITSRPELMSAERIIDRTQVDGREGTLTTLKGWSDRTLTLGAALLGADIPMRYREVTARIRVAETLYFSHDPAVYYKVKSVAVSKLNMILSHLGEFTVEFTCAPFAYMRGVETITLTETATIENPGSVYSLPRVKVYGTGRRNLKVNGSLITLNLLSSPLVLDSELMECCFGALARNNLMQGDFPLFKVGTNTIELGSGITQVEIEPGWRYL